jgi:tRNA(Ile)-lysidine synthase
VDERDARRPVRQAVRDSGLLLDGRPVLVMLSGGQDSVCLLDVAVALCEPGDVSALHVNYGLREQADADERLCRELCGRLGLKLHVVRAGTWPRLGEEVGATCGPGGDVGGVSPAAARGASPSADGGPSGNLHAWARDVRYAAAERAAEEGDALIATGHTASDQVETILYRLAASPGRRALLGMAAAEGRLIRPLLAIRREQTAPYCRGAAAPPAARDPARADGRLLPCGGPRMGDRREQRRSEIRAGAGP